MIAVRIRDISRDVYRRSIDPMRAAQPYTRTSKPTTSAASCTESGGTVESVCFLPRFGLWIRNLFTPPWTKSMPCLAR